MEAHGELMRVEHELAETARRVATGSATHHELDEANSVVVGLRARSELLMQQYLSSRSRP